MRLKTRRWGGWWGGRSGNRRFGRHPTADRARAAAAGALVGRPRGHRVASRRRAAPRDGGWSVGGRAAGARARASPTTRAVGGPHRDRRGAAASVTLLRRRGAQNDDARARHAVSRGTVRGWITPRDPHRARACAFWILCIFLAVFEHAWHQSATSLVLGILLGVRLKRDDGGIYTGAWRGGNGVPAPVAWTHTRPAAACAARHTSCRHHPLPAWLSLVGRGGVRPCPPSPTHPVLGLPNWFARPNQFIRCVR